MKTLIKKGASLGKKACQVAHTKLITNPTALSLGLGTVLIVGGLTDIAFAQRTEDVDDFRDENIIFAAELLLGFMEGGLGALLMIVAGIAAIFAAAMGAYRAAVSLIVVAVGAFILRTLVHAFFPDVIDSDANV